MGFFFIICIKTFGKILTTFLYYCNYNLFCWPQSILVQLKVGVSYQVYTFLIFWVSNYYDVCYGTERHFTRKMSFQAYLQNRFYQCSLKYLQHVIYRITIPENGFIARQSDQVDKFIYFGTISYFMLLTNSMFCVSRKDSWDFYIIRYFFSFLFWNMKKWIRKLMIFLKYTDVCNVIQKVYIIFWLCKQIFYASAK